MLEHLPNLQSLLVSQLSFFDHGALTALSVRSEQGQGDGDDDRDRDGMRRSYALRLLLAQHEPNTTSAGIAEALRCFPRLVYLDLSYTTPARDESVISALSRLCDLQVLKLRGIGLQDADVDALATAIGTRVRLLDLRNNALTDAALGSLLRACFRPPEVIAVDDHDHDGDDNFGGYPQTQSRYEWSISATTTNVLGADSLRSELLDDHFRRQLSTPLTGRTAPEDLPHVGITHLYVADNHVSVEGLANLLSTARLHVLDGGTVETAENIKRRRQLQQRGPNAGFRDFVTTVRFPGAEKLVPTLAGPAARNLTYLRAHHAVVTGDVPVTRESLSMGSLGAELPVGGGGAERSRRGVGPGTVSSKRSERQETGGRVGAPVSGSETIEKGSSHQLSPFQVDGVSRNSTTTVSSSSHPLSEKIQQLQSKRPKLSIPHLHPSHLSHLRTLVLTDVPSSVPSSSPILPSLIRFLTACADETLLATLRARTNYSLPPGLARATAERQDAKSLFSLQRIELEITPVRGHDMRHGRALPSAWMPQGYYNPGVAKSSTGDTDSEDLWAAAVDDFSFFSERECGVPDDEETGKVETPSSSSTTTTTSQQRHDDPEIDLVRSLADFRNAKRREYEALASSSSSSSGHATSVPLHVEGHWKGQVKVVRNPTPKGSGEAVVDSYGYYFEKGYLYS